MEWRWNSKTAMAAAALACAALVVTACEPSERGSGGESSQEAMGGDFELDGDPAAGEEVFSRQCVSCHGQEGAGDGPAGAALDPAPTDFTRAELEPGQTFRVVRDGGGAVGKSAVMPSFERPLDEQELHDVTAYVLSLSGS